MAVRIAPSIVSIDIDVDATEGDIKQSEEMVAKMLPAYRQVKSNTTKTAKKDK